MEASQKKLSIFISHSSKDNEFGMKLAQDLKRMLEDKCEVWCDIEGGLKPGDSWWNEIVKALNACDLFLLVVSPQAMQSEWVIREFDIALQKHKKIIPLFYRKSDVRADINTIQGISFLPPKKYQDAINELLKALGLTVIYIEPEKQDERQRAKQDYFNQGLADRRAKRFGDALVAFNHVIEIDPFDAYAYGRRADVYRALRQFDLSLSDFERAFELNPASATAWAHATRGRVYMGMKNYKRACEDLDRAYELAPNDEWVKRWKKEVYEGLEKQRV